MLSNATKNWNPINPRADENIGAEYLNQGEYEKAIAAFKQALIRQPDAATYSNMGTALIDLGRYPESVTAFERARAMSPNDYAPTFVGNVLARNAYRWAGRKQDADSTYRRAIALAHSQLEVNPRDTDMMANLALFHAKTAEKDDAMDWIRQARALSPEDVYLEYDLAVIYALAGENDNACGTLREAISKGYSEKAARSDPELGSLLSGKKLQ